MYLFILLVGAFGFVAMTLLGMSHGLGGHHGNSIGHPRTHLPPGGSHHSGLVLKGGGGKTAPAKTAAKAGSGMHGGDPWKLLMALSPIDVFAVMVGAGAAGTLLKTVLIGWQLGLCAFVGGALFAFGVIRPTMGFLMRFASRPSEGLEGEVSSLAEATTRFDSDGRGLIKVVLDEQNVQLLATLDRSERENGVQVAKGEQVVIVSVDAVRNTCVVSRELAP